MMARSDSKIRSSRLWPSIKFKLWDSTLHVYFKIISLSPNKVLNTISHCHWVSHILRLMKSKIVITMCLMSCHLIWIPNIKSVSLVDERNKKSLLLDHWLWNQICLSLTNLLVIWMRKIVSWSQIWLSQYIVKAFLFCLLLMIWV